MLERFTMRILQMSRFLFVLVGALVACTGGPRYIGTDDDAPTHDGGAIDSSGPGEDGAMPDADPEAPDANPPAASSCDGLGNTCGSTGTSDCCAAATVTGGTYYRGFDSAPDELFTNTDAPATVSNFVLDTYEVTVGRFRNFIEAGHGTQQGPPGAGDGAHTGISGSGWSSGWNPSLTANPTALIAALKCDATYQTWTDTPGSNESKPINCVTWYEAFAFCIWDGGYLPTEAEWHLAASGGSEQRAYPWSSPAGSTDISCAHANYDPGTNCVASGANRVGSESLGNGRWGHADLAGNVREWVLDYHASPYPTPCNNCANLTPGTNRAVRGGGHSSSAVLLRVPTRSVVAPTDRSYSLGFRCARAP
jgi:formylglycine-generating enzyme required for sulfatase activity